MLKVVNIPPVYGEHYAPGYVGFTYKVSSLLSAGISYFTYWDSLAEISVTHCFVVESEKEGIEAHYGTGVRRVVLKELFDDPQLVVVFRKPRDLEFIEAQQMLSVLRPELGKHYDTSLIISHAVSNLFLGGRVGRWLSSVLAKWCDSIDEWICSELVVYGLLAVPRFKNVGCLRHPPRMITPQQLFEDDKVFEVWDNKGGA